MKSFKEFLEVYHNHLMEEPHQHKTYVIPDNTPTGPEEFQRLIDEIEAEEKLKKLKKSSWWSRLMKKAPWIRFASKVMGPIAFLELLGGEAAGEVIDWDMEYLAEPETGPNEEDLAIQAMIEDGVLDDDGTPFMGPFPGGVWPHETWVGDFDNPFTVESYKNRNHNKCLREQ